MSFGLHAAFVLAFLVPLGVAAYEEGSGEDVMVVEQGIAIEGFAKLGDSVTEIEPIEATPAQTSLPTPPPEELKTVEEETEVISSKEGPEQEPVFEPKPEEVKETPPPQIAALEQESVAQEQQSSGQQRLGGDTTAQSAYLGALRSHLERSKINPRSQIVGTAVVHFVVDASGRVVSRVVSVSSGNKILDDAAVASIDKASPFPAMPKGLNRDRFEISVPFKFSVR